MTRNETLVLLGLLGVGGAVVFLCRPKVDKSTGEGLANPRMDPDFGSHRGRPVVYRIGSGIGAPLRLGSRQEPLVLDKAGYPYGGKKDEPSLLAQGYWKGKGDGPLGYSPVDYGPTPRRIPRLWRDSIRYWDGIAQRGYSQQNYRVFLFHLRPAAPTRGYRSVSGILYNGGPTSSRRRIPAVFVPTAVS